MRNSRTTLALSIAVAAALLPVGTSSAAAAAGSYNGLPNGTKQVKTLVIGIDGTRYDKLLTADAPNLKALIASGTTATSNLYANPLAPTLSGPGWSTIATGVWPDKHKVLDNAFTGARFDLYPDWASRLEAADPGNSTLVIGSWNPITANVFNGAADLRIPESENDAKTASDAADFLAHGNPDAVFLHFDEVDEAGHSYGGTSSQYLAAIHGVDGLVGQVMAGLKSRPGYASEDWLVVLTTDHGHTDAGGHGGNSANERQTWMVLNGRGYQAGAHRYDVKPVDIAPTVLKHQGAPIDPAWGLDGTPVDEIVPDAFDALRPTLQSRVDETGIASTVKGFTHTPPAGWSIDNSRMPSGGVTEWRGWAFATDEFWTAAQLGQSRETNVRARNVFAVADSDEWDDKTHGTGQFDSTLISPAYPVAGLSRGTLSFATDYKIDGPQTGDVYVVFDNGAPQLVKSYRADLNTVEHLNVTVPAGASTARFQFRYTGTNSAFWTVDQVAFTG
ncbi:alkaline phosphatase family protein [Kitasatospora cheerisanensis]|uniref:Nucleotide pyrophosphatase n=1 Tax=Kitasatospora cheerisanensis KCTC 2395 TaxID=1348663 RepID=A0A066YIJ2_9ACTN|nr:alkaline phosphatase family protein [Kitasatospora cheerisanensis]KDN80982.1 nucleotide pyrophosphatase [Kitasatospora cheerisanensis KCTC 2395]